MASEPMTTPEPSPLSEPLTEDEFRLLETLMLSGLRVRRNLARRLIAQARAARPSLWQPIETAPHNKPVLVSYINALGNRRTVKATYYDPGMLAMAEDGDVDDADENGNNVHGGWFEESEEIEACALLSCAPTHWQPLPSPPAQDGGRP